MKTTLSLVLIPFLYTYPVFAGDAFKFPKQIIYKLSQDGKTVGQCELNYSETSKVKGTSFLVLRNFKGLGFTSNDTIYTYFLSDQQTLFSTFLKRGTTTIYETRLKEDTEGVFGGKSDTFIYKENRDGHSGKPITNELFTEYPALDLLLSFYATSGRVADGSYKEPKKFNMFFEKKIRIIEITHNGSQKITINGKTMNAKELDIALDGNKLFSLMVATNKQGYTYPAKILFEDEKKGQAVLTADKIE